MAFIPTGSRLASLGNALGEGAIEPIKTGLGLLTQQKVQDLAMAQQQRMAQQTSQREAQGLIGIGLPAEIAQSIVMLGPDQKKAVLQNLEPLLNFSSQQQGSGIIPQFNGGISGNIQQQGGISDLFKPPLSPDTRARLGQERELFGLKEETAERRHKENLTFKQQEAGLKNQAQELKKQEQINKENTPFAEYIKKIQAPAEKLNNMVDEALALLDTGKVATGTKARLQPEFAQSPETQAYISITNAIPLLQGESAGNTSKFITQLRQSTKPFAKQDEKAQRYLWNQLKKDATKDLNLVRAAESIIEENGGIAPRNLKGLATKRSRGVAPSENASEYIDGTQWKMPDGTIWTAMNGKWERK